jgi:hypothetical protein
MPREKADEEPVEMTADEEPILTQDQVDYLIVELGSPRARAAAARRIEEWRRQREDEAKKEAAEAAQASLSDRK